MFQNGGAGNVVQVRREISCGLRREEQRLRDGHAEDDESRREGIEARIERRDYV
jgi:hypothetical protein